MVRRYPQVSLPALLVTAALLAGCGSSSSSSSSSSSTSSPATSSTPATTQTSSTATATTPSSTATAPTQTSSTATAPTTSTGTSGSFKPPAGATTAASCKHGVEGLRTLKASTKAKLETICEKAGSGDPNAIRNAAEEACHELVNASPLPAGSEKDRALAACKNAGAAGGK
jgi:predicted lipid-binding transport protein (Tim44 family)